jgi:hypothetical protein
MKSLVFLLTMLLLAIGIGAPCKVSAQTALSAYTMTSVPDKIAFTIGAHANVLKAPWRSLYSGEGVYSYSRTKTAAWIDTLYIPGADSTHSGIDSTCTISVERENLSWLKPGGATFTLNYPTITYLANPALSGRKQNWVIFNFPAADTLVSKIRIKKPFKN